MNEIYKAYGSVDGATRIGLECQEVIGESMKQTDAAAETIKGFFRKYREIKRV